MTIKFNLSDFEISGEWDENSRLLLLENLGGTVTLMGKVMGWKINARVTMESGINNLIYLRFNGVDGIPNFLLPWVLKLLKRLNRDVFKDEAFVIRKDTVLVDPNRLFESFKVLIQPKSETEKSPEKVIPQVRIRILNWAQEHGRELAKDITEMVLVIPDLVLLLIKLIKDQRVPVELKLKITLAVAYVVSPIDLIPEALGNVLGFVDDTLAMAVLITGLIQEIPNEIIYDNWNGRPDILELILKGKDLLSKMLPGNITKKINALFSVAQKEAAVTVDDVEKNV